MSVTIRDIAKATSLSLGTISRALKNQSGLTEATRVRVFEVARQLGYDFSKLKSGRVRRIAFLLHRQHNTLSSSPFFSPVLHGAEAACRREGIALSFVAIGPAEPVMEQIRVHQPDAILCAGFFEPEILHAIRSAGKPLVLIDMYLDDFTSINPDNRLGGYLATRHLIQSGRKRIAMLSGPSAHYSIQERVHGFRKALYDAKMLANPELEIAIPHHANEEASVKKAMLKLLAMTQRPDAVFCYNDTTALTAMQACLEAGLKIP
ncbi:MAG: LacI family transcriptional regulator, partial [Burkholderiaceae bacterium]